MPEGKCVEVQENGYQPRFSLSVDAAVEPVNHLGRSNSEYVTNTKQGSDRNRSSRFDLLPVASGESKTNHVFLRVPLGFSQPLHPLAEGMEKLFLVHHTAFLGDYRAEHHERI